MMFGRQPSWGPPGGPAIPPRPPPTGAPPAASAGPAVPPRPNISDWLSQFSFERTLSSSNDALEWIRDPVTGTTIESPVMLRCLHSVGKGSLPQIGTVSLRFLPLPLSCRRSAPAVAFDSCHSVLVSVAARGEKGMECPVCHEMTMLGPDGENSLPENVALRAIVDRLEAMKQPCGNCKTPASAQIRCDGCRALLCKACDEKLHKIPLFEHHQRHPIVNSTDFLLCQEHPGEKVTLFCLEDQVPVCPYCIISGSHLNHECVPLADTAKDLRTNLMDITRQVGARQETLLRGEEAVMKRMQEVHLVSSFAANVGRCSIAAARAPLSLTPVRFPSLFFAVCAQNCDLLAQRIAARFDDLITSIYTRQYSLLDSVEAFRRVKRMCSHTAHLSLL